MGELGAASQAAPAKSLNPDEIGETAKEKRPNAAFESALLVFSSGYLLAIVGIVGMYEIVSTVVDFQFTAMVAHYLEGASIGNHFSLVYAITKLCGAGYPTPSHQLCHAAVWRGYCAVFPAYCSIARFGRFSDCADTDRRECAEYHRQWV